jgi:SAM-dependent methyltransferase
MTPDDRDDDVVELTPDLIADETAEAAPAPAAAPKKRRGPPPGNPFTLLVDPKAERESVLPQEPPLPAEPRASRPSFVPELKADPVAAIPIRKLDDAAAAPQETAPAKGGDDSLPAARISEPAPAPGDATAGEGEAAAAEAGTATETDDEILDLGQEYVVDGQVSDAEVGTEPIPLTRPSLAPAEPAAAAPEPTLAPTPEPTPAAPGPTPEPTTAATTEGAATEAHAFDFGTPEMVFDRVAESEEAVEEVDDAELEEEPVRAEPEGEEIDLAEVVEVEEAAAPPALVPAPVPGAPHPRRRRRKGAKEWWASIFDDDFLAVMPAYSKRDTRRELDLIVDSLGVEPGGLLLDLGCGAGRHAIGMARRNYRVVGVDLSLSMLARAGELAQEAGQKINFIHGDMRDLGFDQTFDGVYCMGTSFGYFDDTVNVKVVEGVHRALKPGGLFLLEIANRDHAITRQPNLLWFEMGDIVSMEETDFNYINSRLYVNRQIILDGGQRQTKHEYSVRLYSLHEIGQILHSCGFAVTRVSGHSSSPGAFFGVDSQKLIIVAQRRR